MTDLTDELLRAEIKALGERVDLKLAIIGKDITFTSRTTEQIVQLLREQQGEITDTVKDVSARVKALELLASNLQGRTAAIVGVGGVLVTLMNLAISLWK